MAWAAEHWAARFASGLDWLQFVSRCERLCGARERARRSRPLSSRVSTAVRGGLFCVAPEPHGLGGGSSNVCAMVVACTVVGAVVLVVGCSRGRDFSKRLFTLYLRSDKSLSFFRLVAAATRRWNNASHALFIAFTVPVYCCYRPVIRRKSTHRRAIKLCRYIHIR